jgi:DnaK suppressor protein
MSDTNTVKPIFTPYQMNEGEEYMCDTQLEHFRQILLQWKKNLMMGVEKTVHHMQDDASNFPDPNDRATQEEEFTIELRTRDRERKLIKKIDEAMKTIDIEEYGFCTDCGAEIGLRRLEARSTATKCIDCKTRDEIREKHKVK